MERITASQERGTLWSAWPGTTSPNTPIPGSLPLGIGDGQRPVDQMVKPIQPWRDSSPYTEGVRRLVDDRLKPGT